MILSDYISIFIIAKPTEEAQARWIPPFKQIFSRSDITERVSRELGGANYSKMEANIDKAIEKLVCCGVALAILTPHAAPRYSITYNSPFCNPADLDLPPGMALIANHFADLGRGWLVESIESASSLDDDVIVLDSGLRADVQWAPLPLERPDAELDRVIESVERLAEQVRSDNGYALQPDGERDDVIVRLRDASSYLRDATAVSRVGVETYIVWPLQRLIARFGPAAIGAAAKLVLDIFSAWLKNKLGV